MSKKHFIVLVAIALFIQVAFVYAKTPLEDRLEKVLTRLEKIFGVEGQENDQLGGGFFIDKCSLTGTTTVAATTTAIYMNAAGATTTNQIFGCQTEGADVIDLNMNFAASSTASQLLWEIQFSNNNIDWYSEDGKTVDSEVNTTHGATAKVHLWTPGKIATSSKNIGIEPVASKRTRILFNSAGANGAISAEMLLRRQLLR
mgnify:CR=1 FL=1